MYCDCVEAKVASIIPSLEFAIAISMGSAVFFGQAEGNFGFVYKPGL